MVCRPSKYSIRNAPDILEYQKVSYYLRHQSFTPTPLPECLHPVLYTHMGSKESRGSHFEFFLAASFQPPLTTIICF